MGLLWARATTSSYHNASICTRPRLRRFDTASARQHRSRCWTQHDLQPVQGNQVSEFTTHFKVEDYYRASNVRRAAKRLDGIVLSQNKR